MESEAKNSTQKTTPSQVWHDELELSEHVTSQWYRRESSGSISLQGQVKLPLEEIQQLSPHLQSQGVQMDVWGMSLEGATNNLGTTDYFSQIVGTFNLTGINPTIFNSLGLVVSPSCLGSPFAGHSGVKGGEVEEIARHVKLKETSPQINSDSLNDSIESEFESKPKKKRNRKKATCAVCGLILSRVDHARRHMLTHTGQKDYKCEVCGRTFSRSDEAKRHARLH